MDVSTYGSQMPNAKHLRAISMAGCLPSTFDLLIFLNKFAQLMYNCFKLQICKINNNNNIPFIKLFL